MGGAAPQEINAPPAPAAGAASARGAAPGVPAALTSVAPGPDSCMLASVHCDLQGGRHGGRPGCKKREPSSSRRLFCLGKGPLRARGITGQRDRDVFALRGGRSSAAALGGRRTRRIAYKDHSAFAPFFEQSRVDQALDRADADLAATGIFAGAVPGAGQWLVTDLVGFEPAEAPFDFAAPDGVAAR